MPFQCYRYEGQDVLSELDDVDLLPVEARPGFRLTERWQRRLLWHDVSRQLAYVNPGLRPVKLTQEYDLFIATCENWWDLLYINAIQGWKDRCRTSVLWLDELFVASLPRYKYWLQSLLRFDHIVLGHPTSVDGLSAALNRPCHWLPAAVDVLRFHPCPETPSRVVDVLSVGRRFEGIHDVLRRLAAETNMFYVHDTLVGTSLEVADYRQHREQLANMLRRSRCFVVGPGMMGEAESGSEPIVGLRFYEGTAAGAVLIGQSPDCDAYRTLFDWPDAVVEFAPDGSDTAQKLASMAAEPERLARISNRNTAEAARRHDWVYRWKQIYEIAGLATTPAMEARQRRLEEIAERATDAGHAPLLQFARRG